MTSDMNRNMASHQKQASAATPSMPKMPTISGAPSMPSTPSIKMPKF